MENNFLVKSKLLGNPLLLNDRLDWLIYLKEYYEYLLLYQSGFKGLDDFYNVYNPFHGIRRYYKKSKKNLRLIKSRLKNIKKKLKAVKRICPFCGNKVSLDEFLYGFCYCKCFLCNLKENTLD